MNQKRFGLMLDIEDVAILTDEQAATAVGGGNGTLGCTPPCVNTVSADCTTGGCKPTSSGCVPDANAPAV